MRALWQAQLGAENNTPPPKVHWCWQYKWSDLVPSRQVRITLNRLQIQHGWEPRRQAQLRAESNTQPQKVHWCRQYRLSDQVPSRQVRIALNRLQIQHGWETRSQAQSGAENSTPHPNVHWCRHCKWSDLVPSRQMRITLNRYRLVERIRDEPSQAEGSTLPPNVCLQCLHQWAFVLLSAPGWHSWEPWRQAQSGAENSTPPPKVHWCRQYKWSDLAPSRQVRITLNRLQIQLQMQHSWEPWRQAVLNKKHLKNMSHLLTKPTKWLCAQQRLRSA